MAPTNGNLSFLDDINIANHAFESLVVIVSHDWERKPNIWLSCVGIKHMVLAFLGITEFFLNWETNNESIKCLWWSFRVLCNDLLIYVDTSGRLPIPLACNIVSIFVVFGF